jgi:hypothetical protein
MSPTPRDLNELWQRIENELMHLRKFADAFLGPVIGAEVDAFLCHNEFECALDLLVACLCDKPESLVSGEIVESVRLLEVLMDLPPDLSRRLTATVKKKGLG